MSIQSSPANKFLGLPDEVISSIFSYLDDRTVLATAAVSRTWRDDLALRRERREPTARLPQRIKLQESHRELGRLIEEHRKRNYNLLCMINPNLLDGLREVFTETPLKARCKELMPSPSQLVAAKKWQTTRAKVVSAVALIALGYLLSCFLGD